MNRVITIGRQFGSGGRQLGKNLAEKLGIPYYDQEIVKEIANRTLLPETYVQQVIERKKIIVLPLVTVKSIQMLINPEFEESNAIFNEQSKIIREMAGKSDCVIVGRCADYVLKDMNPFRIFVYGNAESKVQRCRRYMEEHENLTDKELEKMMTDIDKKRETFYQFHTGQKWGDPLNYDLCINTSTVSIEEIVPVLANYIS